MVLRSGRAPSRSFTFSDLTHRARPRRPRGALAAPALRRRPCDARKNLGFHGPKTRGPEIGTVRTRTPGLRFVINLTVTNYTRVQRFASRSVSPLRSERARPSPRDARRPSRQYPKGPWWSTPSPRSPSNGSPTGHSGGARSAGRQHTPHSHGVWIDLKNGARVYCNLLRI